MLRVAALILMRRHGCLFGVLRVLPAASTHCPDTPAHRSSSGRPEGSTIRGKQVVFPRAESSASGFHLKTSLGLLAHSMRLRLFALDRSSKKPRRCYLTKIVTLPMYGIDVTSAPQAQWFLLLLFQVVNGFGLNIGLMTLFFGRGGEGGDW